MKDDKCANGGGGWGTVCDGGGASRAPSGQGGEGAAPVSSVAGRRRAAPGEKNDNTIKAPAAEPVEPK